MRRWRVPLWLELSAAILIALIASNAVTFAVVEVQRAREIKAERMGAIEDRIAALMNLLGRVPETARADLFKVASVRRERVSIGAIPRVAQDAARDEEAEARLTAALGALATGDVRVAKRGLPEVLPFAAKRRGGIERLSVAVALAPGQWLNAEFYWPEGASLLPGLLLSAAVASFALLIVAVWLAYRLSRPLQRLAAASSEMAHGRAGAPIPESGPFVLRTATAAFNTMSRRLMATLENQRVLLASIAHDLRTPITSLKLKSEFIDDGEVRDGMRASLDELQALTEAALEAARSGAGEEAAREVDVAALVESLCADLSELGGEVVFAEAGPVTALCRPHEIKRAARNLVENALKYGKQARVAVAVQDAVVAITVDDAGPGLTADEASRVFEPFVRLNASGAGGLGLGLTLARAVARGHGGDVVLENRSEGGLRATLTLKRTSAATG
ncbi:MAG: HAMP domain-containing protein [Alphaproteobacteria bacterium]|nr:HAMP domain-containing protein [Alphaproteobacteria bacterium]